MTANPQKTFLVVDDDHITRAILQRFLERLGHRVMIAESGEQALAVFAAGRPDVVLMDVLMPGMGGLEATRQIRAASEPDWVPVVLVSGLADDRDLAAGLAAGGDDYLYKPVQFSLFAPKISNVLRMLEKHRQLDAMRLQLEKNEAYFRRMFELAPLPYQSLDIDGRLTAINEAWLELFGYRSKDEVLGRFFGEFMSESSRLLMGMTFEKFKQQRFVNSPVFEAQRQGSDQTMLITVSGRIESDERGNFVRTHCILTDVSERARVEENIRRMNAELEAKVLQRTSELATARSEAEMANAVKTRFMSNVSHEMRTPLQGILGFADIGRRKAEQSGSELLPYFQKIEFSGKRMNALVESLLHLVQQASDEITGDDGNPWQPIRTKAFVNEIMMLKSPEASRREQTLALDMPDGIADFEGDPARLRQVFEHLLENAFKYSPASATISLRIANGELALASGQTLAAICFQIIDQGCGIPESEIKAIFEPFYQSSRTATGAGGTGLGLPLSRAIIKRHKGSLTASNRPEGGAMFVVMLPLQLAEAGGAALEH